ncbi:MAG: (S)-2-haloacid dehalogenase [Pseudomonadota bacterium]|jgi:2-haloacid dehalogenase
MKSNLKKIQALTFDVFGTVVDWRGSIIREMKLLAREKNITIDAAAFADGWRAGYQPAMQRVRSGDLPWMNIDALHRIILDDLLKKFSITGLTEDEKIHLNKVWHRLKPWSDTVRGLKRLKKKYIITTLSNGNVSLLTNMAKFGGLPWDCIISAELAKHYKPDPEAYQMAAALLDLRTDEVLMVAAHKSDLVAAQKTGNRAAFITRPLEYGADFKNDISREKSFDLHALDFNDLADQLGC